MRSKGNYLVAVGERFSVKHCTFSPVFNNLSLLTPLKTYFVLYTVQKEALLEALLPNIHSLYGRLDL